MAVLRDRSAELCAVTEELISDMTGTTRSGSVSLCFIRQIIPYFKAGAAMSDVILRYTTNANVEKFARATKHATEGFAAAARRIEGETVAAADRLRDSRIYNRNADVLMNNMFYRMSAVKLKERANCDFLSKIVPHHEGGILFCENLLGFDAEIEVRSFASAAVGFLNENKKIALEIAETVSCGL